MRTHVAASAAVTLLLAAGCNQSVSTKSVDIEKERTALMSVDRELSVALESAERSKLASFYAPDASVYAPGMKVIKGQEAIGKLLEDPLSAEGTVFDITTTQAHVSAGGDIAYTTGTWTLSRTGGRTENGKYVTIWRKQDDGSWRIVEDIFNLDEAGGSEPVASVR